MNDLKKFVATNPERFERFLSRVEIVGLLLAMAAVLMMTNKINGGNALLNIGLSTLSALYFCYAVIGPQIFRVQSSKSFATALQAGYIGLAITMMGILFIMMRWPGGNLMMNVGSAITGVMFLYFTYKMYFGTLDAEGHRVIINNLIVRMLPALVVVAILIALYFKT